MIDGDLVLFTCVCLFLVLFIVLDYKLSEYSSNLTKQEGTEIVKPYVPKGIEPVEVDMDVVNKLIGGENNEWTHIEWKKYFFNLHI